MCHKRSEGGDIGPWKRIPLVFLSGNVPRGACKKMKGGKIFRIAISYNPKTRQNQASTPTPHTAI